MYTWWQQQTTSIIHCGYRVVNEYEVVVDNQGQRYTGQCRQVYVPA